MKTIYTPYDSNAAITICAPIVIAMNFETVRKLHAALASAIASKELVIPYDEFDAMVSLKASIENSKVPL